MSFPISSIGGASPIAPIGPNQKAGSGFGAVLEDAIHKVEEFKTTASNGVEAFLSGEGEDLHKTIMATQRAELAMELFQQVRNKVVLAYQEVMRMQV